ncbi:cation:proton antiporter [Nocardioides ginkgobilobae]
MAADLVYLVAGLSLILAVVLPAVLQRAPVTSPMLLIGLGMLLGLTPLPDGLPLDPQDNRAAIEHVTELTVIVALMGVGLAIDRPLSLRRRASWSAWSPTWRLLGVAMPLSIAAVALLGWALGAAPAVALLLGAVLAPTDPVLASDVQVGGPSVTEDEEDAEAETESDEVRFALTSEAGLNDGLAFPFVYAAVLLAGGSAVDWGARWVAWELLGKVLIGVLAGIGVGTVLARVAFRSDHPALRVADRGEPLFALAALLTAYGLGEVAQGYGFLAVFACAMTIRAAERRHSYHRDMHEVVERLERLLTLFVLLVLGIALTRGLLGALDWRGVLVGVALVAVLRPAAAWLALAVRPAREEPGRLLPGERVATAFFGVRGVGSLYYLAYAGGEVEAFQDDWLWSSVGFTIVLSVVVHGALAGPVMRRLECRRAGDPAR